MANTPFQNFVLENKFEDQYNSYLDLMQFCTVDRSLVGEPGMFKRIRVYSATNNKTQVLTQGQGNTQSIEVGYADVDYPIHLLQNRFEWYDEEAMTDPLIVDKGIGHQAVDMFNTANAEAIAEFAKATNSLQVTAFNFNAIVDGVAGMTALDIVEAKEKGALGLFALCHKDNVAELRKNLGLSLQYVEAYARTGYIGTVAGVNIYTSALATKDEMYIADKKAVTYFVKTGTQVEQEREANTRHNSAYFRKYGIFALTDQNHIIKLYK